MSQWKHSVSIFLLAHLFPSAGFWCEFNFQPLMSLVFSNRFALLPIWRSLLCCEHVSFTSIILRIYYCSAQLASLLHAFSLSLSVSIISFFLTRLFLGGSLIDKTNISFCIFHIPKLHHKMQTIPGRCLYCNYLWFMQEATRAKTMENRTL